MTLATSPDKSDSMKRTSFPFALLYFSIPITWQRIALVTFWHLPIKDYTYIRVLPTVGLFYCSFHSSISKDLLLPFTFSILNRLLYIQAVNCLWQVITNYASVYFDLLSKTFIHFIQRSWVPISNINAILKNGHQKNMTTKFH